jgi:hypothetical protein
MQDGDVGLSLDNVRCYLRRPSDQPPPGPRDRGLFLRTRQEPSAQRSGSQKVAVTCCIERVESASCVFAYAASLSTGRCPTGATTLVLGPPSSSSRITAPSSDPSTTDGCSTLRLPLSLSAPGAYPSHLQPPPRLHPASLVHRRPLATQAVVLVRTFAFTGLPRLRCIGTLPPCPGAAISAYTASAARLPRATAAGPQLL